MTAKLEMTLERATDVPDDDVQPKREMTTPRETFRARKRACAWGTPPGLERAAGGT